MILPKFYQQQSYAAESAALNCHIDLTSLLIDLEYGDCSASVLNRMFAIAARRRFAFPQGIPTKLYCAAPDYKASYKMLDALRAEKAKLTWLWFEEASDFDRSFTPGLDTGSAAPAPSGATKQEKGITL